MASTYEPEQVATAATARRGLATLFRRLFKEKPFGAAGLIVVLLFFLIGMFANQLAPHDYADQDVPRRLEGPSAEFLLGTDQFGRDSLSRIIHGARISMVVGVLASVFTVLTATLLGVISGYWGGTFDLILQRFVDAVMSFPWLFLVLTAMLLLGPSILSIAVGDRRAVGGRQRAHHPQRGVERPGTRVRRGGARHRRHPVAHPGRARAAADHRPEHHSVHHYARLGDHRRGDGELPRVRDSAAAAHLGRHAQRGGPQVHGGGAGAGAVARPVPGDRGVRNQHIRRRAARSARPAPARRRRAASTEPDDPPGQRADTTE